MTIYTHPDMVGMFGNAKFVMPDGRQFPASWWRTSSPQERAGLGFRVYEPPVEPDPEPSTDPNDYSLLPWQFFVMVDVLGKHDAIMAVIDAITDPWEQAIARRRYLHATSYEFADPLMQQISGAVGVTTEALSDAWMVAKDLRST